MKNSVFEKLMREEMDIALRGRSRRIFSDMNLNTGDKILDAGCGSGYYLNLFRRLKTRGIQMTGVELDMESIKKLKKEFSGDSNIKIVPGDIYNLSFKSDSFSKIIVSEVLEHMERPADALSELYRVLSPGGEIYITVPNHYYPLFWDPLNWVLEHLFKTHVKSGFWAGIWTNHLRLYTPVELETLTKKAGFEITKVESLTRFCLPFNKNILHGGKLPPSLSKKILHHVKRNNKPWYLTIFMYIVNLLDRVNSSLVFSKTGVSVYLRGTKI